MPDLLLALRVVVSLAAVLGALWFLQRRLSRRTARTRTTEALTIVSRQGLGAKSHLVVVDVDGARYLLGVTEAGISVIDRLTAPAAGEAAASSLVTASVPASDEAGLTPPVPLRRLRHRSAPAAPAPLTRDATQLLRRALGA